VLRTQNLKELASAAICLIVGGFFAIASLGMLPLGTSARMGPGYFPLLIGCILVVLGVVLGVRAVVSTDRDAFGSWAPFRGLVAILAAPVAFGLTVRWLGFVPAVFLTVFISTFASERVMLARALLISVALTILGVLLFSLGLGISLPLFGAWGAKLGLP
jgi:hypothetical protein